MKARSCSHLRQRIAMLFQAGALFDSMTVGENVAYGLEEHFREQMTPAEHPRARSVGARARRATGHQEMDPAELSGGMRKRVGLARSIAVEPEVVLYDEPTTGLDPINTARVNHLIIGLQRRLNITSIVVTHDMKSAFSIADRIAMVHGGRIIYQGTTDEFRAATDPRIPTSSRVGPRSTRTWRRCSRREARKRKPLGAEARGRGGERARTTSGDGALPHTSPTTTGQRRSEALGSRQSHGGCARSQSRSVRIFRLRRGRGDHLPDRRQSQLVRPQGSLSRRVRGRARREAGLDRAHGRGGHRLGGEGAVPGRREPDADPGQPEHRAPRGAAHSPEQPCQHRGEGPARRQDGDHHARSTRRSRAAGRQRRAERPSRGFHAGAQPGGYRLRRPRAACSPTWR